MTELEVERDKMQAYLDEGCLRAAEDGEEILPWSVLQVGRQLGLSDQDIESHRLRTARVVELRKTAGTAADLAADTAAAKSAAAALAKDALGAREQIEALEQKVRDLEQAAKNAEARRFRREQARENLRAMAPPWIQERANRAGQRVVAEFRDVERAESRLRVLEQVPALAAAAAAKTPFDTETSQLKHHLEAAAADAEHPEAAALAAKALRTEVSATGTPRRAGDPSSSPHPEGRTQLREWIDEGALADYLALLAAERGKLEPRLAARKAERAKALEEAREALDHYLVD
jgi:hypothetical protein